MPSTLWIPATGFAHYLDDAQNAASTDCALSVQSHDAVVNVSGPQAAPNCVAILHMGLSDGTLLAQPGTLSGTLSQVCSLTSGSNTATVLDDAAQHYGQEICGILSGQGWSGATTATTATTTVSCVSGFQPSSGGCVDERHLPCPPGYSGWQNSQVNNCLENPSP